MKVLAWRGRTLDLVETELARPGRGWCPTFGSIALAGYAVAMRISIFALLPAFGLPTPAATPGQLGAGSPVAPSKPSASPPATTSGSWGSSGWRSWRCRG